jgi:hypothetical protein
MMARSSISQLLLSIVCISGLLNLTSAFVAPKRSPYKAAIQSTEQSFSSLHSFGDLKGITDFFKPKQVEEARPVKPKFDTVIIDPDYRVGVSFLVLGGILDTIPYCQLLPGPFITLLGILFVVQATRVRFVFDEDSIELLNKGEQAGEFKSSGENVIVGKLVVSLPFNVCAKMWTN